MVMRRNRWISKVVAAFVCAAAAVSCMENDTPPPTIKGTILKFEVEGQKGVSFDVVGRTVSVELSETVDPRKVRITRLELNETGKCELAVGDEIDLTSPLTVVVETRAKYEWTIRASQTIERSFKIEPMVGEAYIEEHSCKIFAFVPKGTDLTRIKIVELKLGPEGLTDMEPDDLVGEVVSFRATRENPDKVRDVKVKYRDVEETWSLFVSESDTQLNKVSPFARRVYLAGSGQEGLENGFEYKKYEEPQAAAKFTRTEEGGEEDEDVEDPDGGWIAVPDVSHSKGVFTAWLTGLEPETEYIVRAFSGDSYSPQRRFVTEGVRELPDGSFNVWHKSGKNWNPRPEGTELWWDTGNPGATTLGESNSVPAGKNGYPGLTKLEGCPADPDGTFAYLETKHVSAAGIGKVAGGNIYFGRYAGTDGTNGKCDIGWPWQHRPTGLKGYYQYFPQKIDKDIGALHEHEREKWKNSVDSLNICVALWSMQPDDPYLDDDYREGGTIGFMVNTNPKNFRDFAKDVPGVIAYGAFATDMRQDGWAEFEIRMEYFNTDPLPENTVLFLMATSSKNCNYFTAARGSLMYLDELSLIYD